MSAVETERVVRGNTDVFPYYARLVSNICAMALTDAVGIGASLVLGGTVRENKNGIRFELVEDGVIARCVVEEHEEKGIECKTSSPAIEENWIQGNGWGMYCSYGASPPIRWNVPGSYVMKTLYGRKYLMKLPKAFFKNQTKRINHDFHN